MEARDYPGCLLLAKSVSFSSVVKSDSAESHVCYSDCSLYGLECPRFCGGFGQAHYGDSFDKQMSALGY